MWKIGKHREQLVKMISEAVFLFSFSNMADSAIQFFQPLAEAAKILISTQYGFIKFIYSGKATKFCEIFT